MRSYRWLSKAALALIFGGLALPVYSKPCSPKDWLYLLGSPDNSAIYIGKFGSHRVRFALHYDIATKEFVGEYAKNDSGGTIKFRGPLEGNNSLSFLTEAHHGTASQLKLKFGPESKRDGASGYNSSCGQLDGYASFHGREMDPIHLVMDGGIGPDTRSERMRNEKTAQKLRVFAISGSKKGFQSIFDYPVIVIHPVRSKSAILQTPQEIMKNYSIIMSKAERRWIEDAVPYLLKTGLPGSVFAKNSVCLKNGLVTMICLQTASSIGNSCGPCP